MSLRMKVLSGFLILAVMLAVAGVISIYELRAIGSSVNRLLSENHQSIAAARTMAEALEREDKGMLLALSGKRQEGEETIEAADASFQRALETAKNNAAAPGENEYVGRIASRYRDYRDRWKKALAGGGMERGLDWYVQESRGALQAAKESVNELRILKEEAVYRAASRLQDRANRAVMPGIVGIVSALVFVLVFNYFVNYYVVKPIAVLAREVRDNIRTGKPLSVPVETKDEIRALVSAVEELASLRQKQP